ncbi:MAG: GAF domain-containing protein [Nitrospina sp.]|jgi:HD-GYP domain-containing protein (c-di-GMP phosphodiesterase class II)|nr:GAF domain-containing protein [Nitrospina sp.]MBT3875832.1 GAF domain-containing protein [Nitrospina sp.]MBT4049279.1 GAF domain-containing protein [Nitrospina sp.]MBT4557247.1 GAF domain-containing protein [Nitrospina sp.]MBT5347518.1 GAF domain-containing protein [Nitrospina sp.]
MNDSPKNVKSDETRRFSTDENLNTLLNSVVDEVSAYAERLGGQIKKLSDIGRALSGVYDLNTLLEMIVDQARSFTNADAGTLYIVEDNTLRFQIVQNDSLKIRMGGKTGETIPFPPVELKESNVSAFVALKGVSVNIPDVYDTDLFDFTGPKKFDQSTGYRSKSMLVVPMRNHDNDVIGVLQLLNATNPLNNEVIAFSQDYENLSESLASQAAVSITNAKLISNMTELFEAFVKVMATAIDEKSPVTGGHIRRVADLTLTMADVIHELKEGVFKDKKFTPDQMYELRIAAYMHDIGKVTSPVEIVEKAKKLQTIFDRIHYIRLRMAYISQKVQLEGQEAKIKILQNGSDPEQLKTLEKTTHDQLEELKEIREFINKCNEPGEFLEDETLDRLKELSQKTYIDDEGEQQPLITEDELVNLSIRRGSITEKERGKMQDHAAVTLRMLKQIPFTKKLKNIPDFAGAHHEFINGKGYPLGLKGDEIPFEGKLMAVTDIAEALTASDRPYKKAMPLETVYRILRSMAEKGELDPSLVELFIEKEVYKLYQERHENVSSDK